MNQEVCDVVHLSNGVRLALWVRRWTVTQERLTLIESMVTDQVSTQANAAKLCNVATQITGLSGASILLRCSRTQFTSICATDVLSAKLLDLEITCGEGPATEACQSEHLVQVEDLATFQGARWMMYAPLASLVGAKAVFSFPILLGTTSFGALSLYGNYAGPLSQTQKVDGALLAALVSSTVLALRPGASLDTFGESLEREFDVEYSVHQATGMVAIQGSMNVADAFVVLKFHAFATDSTIVSLARDVVAHHTYFDPRSYAMCDAS